MIAKDLGELLQHKHFSHESSSIALYDWQMEKFLLGVRDCLTAHAS